MCGKSASPPDAVPQLPHPGASGVAPAFMRLWQFFHKSATLSGLFRTAMFFLFARYAFCYTKTPLIKWFADLLGRFPKTLLHTQDTAVFIFNSLPLQSAICFFSPLKFKNTKPGSCFFRLRIHECDIYFFKCLKPLCVLCHIIFHIAFKCFCERNL